MEYGGNRHGFLAFNEIHPDYYRIPIEDREALIAEEAAAGDLDDDDAPLEEEASAQNEAEPPWTPLPTARAARMKATNRSRKRLAATPSMT